MLPISVDRREIENVVLEARHESQNLEPYYKIGKIDRELVEMHIPFEPVFEVEEAGDKQLKMPKVANTSNEILNHVSYIAGSQLPSRHPNDIFRSSSIKDNIGKGELQVISDGSKKNSMKGSAKEIELDLGTQLANQSSTIPSVAEFPGKKSLSNSDYESTDQVFGKLNERPDQEDIEIYFDDVKSIIGNSVVSKSIAHDSSENIYLRSRTNGTGTPEEQAFGSDANFVDDKSIKLEPSQYLGNVHFGRYKEHEPEVVFETVPRADGLLLSEDEGLKTGKLLETPDLKQMFPQESMQSQISDFTKIPDLSREDSTKDPAEEDNFVGWLPVFPDFPFQQEGQHQHKQPPDQEEQQPKHNHTFNDENQHQGQRQGQQQVQHLHQQLDDKLAKSSDKYDDHSGVGKHGGDIVEEPGGKGVDLNTDSRQDEAVPIMSRIQANSYESLPVSDIFGGKHVTWGK